MSKHNVHDGQKNEETPSEAVFAENAAGTGAEAAPGGNTAGSAGTSPGAGQGEAAAQAGDAAKTAAGDEKSAAAAPAEQIAALEARLAEANDQYLRKAADFENFRKRMNQEKQNAIDYANQSLLLDLIPIIDDFDRALKAGEGSGDFTSFYEGVSMIEKRLSSQLENKWGLKRFDSAGEAFDPNRHEAIMMEKSAEIAEPVVQEDFIKGYTLKERVVRAAKVKVLMPEQPAAAGGETPASIDDPALN